MLRPEIGQRASEAWRACRAKKTEFRAGIHTALEYAQTLACPRVHVMAGIQPAGVERAVMRHTFSRNLAWAAELAAACRHSIADRANQHEGHARIFSKPPG